MEVLFQALKSYGIISAFSPLSHRPPALDTLVMSAEILTLQNKLYTGNQFLFHCSKGMIIVIPCEYCGINVWASPFIEVAQETFPSDSWPPCSGVPAYTTGVILI